MDKVARPGDGREERVGYYLERLERYLILCCETKAHKDRWDIFLWSARCAVEAMLLVLNADTPPPNKDDAVGAKLITACNKRGLIQGNVLPTFESIAKYGNLGTHVWTDGQPDFRHGVKHCIAVLPQAVTWFFVESAARRPMPDGVAQALEALSNNEPFLSPEEIEIEKLRSQVRDSSQRLATALAEKADLERQVARLKKQADERERHLEVLDRREPATVAEGIHPKVVKRTQHWGRLALWVALALGLGTVGVYLVSRSRDWRGCSQNAPSSVTTAEGEQRDASGSGPDATAIGEDAEPDEAAVDGGAVDGDAEREVQPLDRPAPVSAGPCPDGMVEVKGGPASVRLPYPRPGWWDQVVFNASPASFPVKGFCIQKSPVTMEEIQTFRGKDSHPLKCRDEAEFRSARGRAECAASGVTWEEANLYCVKRELMLPSIKQWERVVETLGENEFQYLPFKTWFEWALDEYPAEIFQSMTDQPFKIKGNAHHRLRNQVAFCAEKVHPAHVKGSRKGCDFSWNMIEDAKAKNELASFRCAKTLGSAAQP